MRVNGTWIRLQRKRVKNAVWYWDSEELEVMRVDDSCKKSDPGAETYPFIFLDRMLTRSRQQLEVFLTQVKEAYVQERWTTVTIKMIDETDDSGQWREVTTRRKRSLETVITACGVKDKLKQDMKEFLRSEEWYRIRGIPWRRGFLLHGQSHLSIYRIAPNLMV